MKPEFKFKGTEATPADYAQLMQALLSSQAATPTARACAREEDAPAPQSILDTLFGAATVPAEAARARRSAAENNGERAVYPRISGFLEAGESTSPVSGPRPEAAPDRYE